MFRTIYNHARPVSPHGGVSMTDQQYKSECDVNVILKRYAVTGQLPPSARSKTPITGNFADIGDFKNCLDRINAAHDEFAALPAELRARFGNDPTTFVDFVLDERNVDECVKLGLRERPAAPEPTAVDVLKEIRDSVTTKPNGNVAEPA